MTDAFANDDIAALVRGLLDASIPAGSADIFTVEQVRDALATDFDSWAAARAADPTDGCIPLWGLRMHDSDFENAVFVAWVWDTDIVRLGCGCGDSYDVQEFCGARAAAEVDELFEELREQFRMPALLLALPLASVEAWIAEMERAAGVIRRLFVSIRSSGR